MTPTSQTFNFFSRNDEATDVLFRGLKFVDYTDPKMAFFAAVHADKLGQYGRAIKMIQVHSTPDVQPFCARTKVYYFHYLEVDVWCPEYWLGTTCLQCRPCV